MNAPGGVIDIFLQPGELYFGDGATRIRTLLGSCVAVTLWHPRLHIGGMCHYLLPGRRRRPPDSLDGRYADEAIELFRREIRTASTRPQDYQIKLFGGGSMFPGLIAAGKPDHCNRGCRHDPLECRDVACRNVAVGRRLVAELGANITAEHLGGVGHRNIIFEVWSGDVLVRHVPPAPPADTSRVKSK
jgi:chemotaxis protein CheD